MAIYDKTRSLLFVPATRLDRIEKALNSGADVVIVDLEDAVALAEKESARAGLDAYLTKHQGIKVAVRINGADTHQFIDDLEMCAKHDNIRAIVLPKSQSIVSLEQVAELGKPIWPLIETALGDFELPNMVRVKGVERLLLGGLDMGGDLGLKPDTEGALSVIDKIRTDLVMYSKIGGLNPPVETVFPAIDDLDGIEKFARKASQMGFSGMLCIHPHQLPAIHKGFSPSSEELEWAHRVLAMAAKSGKGAFQMDGKMIDAPVIRRARLIAAQADDNATD